MGQSHLCTSLTRKDSVDGRLRMLCKVNENRTQIVYSHIVELLAGDHEEDILEDLLSLQDIIPWSHIEDYVIVAVVAVNDDDLVFPGRLWFAFRPRHG